MPSTFLAVELTCDGPCRFRVPENAYIENPIVDGEGVAADKLSSALTTIGVGVEGPCESWWAVQSEWLNRVRWSHVPDEDLTGYDKLRAIVRDACGFWWGVFEREINNEPA